MKNYKEEILKLRKKGKTYKEIIKILDCAKSTVSYHLSKKIKTNAIKRAIKNKKKYIRKNTLTTIAQQKLCNFKCDSKKNIKKTYHSSNVSIQDIRNILNNNPKCYLTGKKINPLDSSSWSLDHIIPRSKGGKNNIDNLGLSCSKANKCKHDLLLEEFIKTCKEVLINFGYKITKGGGGVGVLPSECL
jgi:5-methylcytosine-specific restriction endonuclease McrA